MPTRQELRVGKSSIYIENGEGKLLVPTATMQRLHDAGVAASICRRAGLPIDTLTRWRTKFSSVWPWLKEWLRGGAVPDGVQIHWPAWTRKGVQPKEGDFAPTEEMMVFRHEAMQNALLRAIRKQSGNGSGRRRDQAHAHYMKALRPHQQLPWFAAWLLRGEDAPRDVKIATQSQIQRALTAWDHVAHRESAGISESQFERWFKAFIPSEARWPFLLWLYGGPAPVGWTIITPAMRRARQVPVIPNIRNPWLREAGRRSGEPVVAELKHYLDGETATQDGREFHRHRGVIAPGLYLPPDRMEAFRDIARKAMVAKQISVLMKELPCVRQWMETWAFPVQRHYETATVAQIAAPKAEHAGHAATTEEKDVRTDEPTSGIHTPFNDTDNAILKLLDAGPLKGETIADRIDMSFGYVRRRLARLTKLGVLVNNDQGYGRLKMLPHER